MKKYKLIKWYPSLGNIEEGFEVIQEKLDGNYHPTTSCDRVIFKPCEIENNTEFWQEVVEKDYEILSLQGNKNNAEPGCIIPIKDGKVWGIYSLENHIYKYNFYNNSHIYSVKRLSDGEIFTIGDLVARHPSWEYGTPCYITSFIFKKGKLTYNIKQGDKSGNYPFDSFTYKYKKPLFTTEDGFDIVDEDEGLWFVTPKNGVLSTRGGHGHNFEKFKYFLKKEAAEEYIKKNTIVFTTEDNVKITKSDYSEIYGVALQATSTDMLRKGYAEGIGEYELPYPNRKWFKYKENAEEYILMNKPCLSINDVFKIYPKYTKHAEDLIKLAKSKL